MILAALGWRLLARLETFQTHRERLLADLEHRVDERTEALATVNRQLHDSKVRLMEADRRKDEFLATLAHELRNPLAPIRTGLEILKSDGVSPLVAAQAHQVIGRQMRHLVRLIDDLLDVSRITANKLDLRLERVEVGGDPPPGRRDHPRRHRTGPARPHAAPAAAWHRRARRRRRG